MGSCAKLMRILMFKPYNDFLHLRNLKEQEDIATCSLQYPPTLSRRLDFIIAKDLFMQ